MIRHHDQHIVRMSGRVARFIAQHPVDVGHVHNFFPLLTPAVHETLYLLEPAGVRASCSTRVMPRAWPPRVANFQAIPIG